MCFITVICPVDLHCITGLPVCLPSHHSNSKSQFLSSLDALVGDQQLMQLLTANSPAWQHLSGDTSSRLLLHLVMLIERQAGLAEVLPWLWPLADEDSGCTVHAAPSLQTRLLAALIAVPEGMDNALGGKVSLVDMRMQNCCCLLKVCHVALLQNKGPAARMSCYIAVQPWYFGRLLALPSLYLSSKVVALMYMSYQIKLCAGGSVVVHPASCLVVAGPS